MPKYIHDCEGCIFLGTDSQDTDWYVHNSVSGRGRTLLRRFSDTPSDYESGTIGETVTPQRIVIRAARMGFEFNDTEMRIFAKAYVYNFKEYKSMADSAEGPLWSDETLLKGEDQ